MEYRLKAYGHENITAKHKTTLEFTKDKNLSLNGDCIVGVNADFDLLSLKKFIKKLKDNQVTIVIKTIPSNKNQKTIFEKIKAEINPDFNSNDELVIRKTGFISERTFAIKADKAAFELKKQLTLFLKKKNCEISIVIKDI